MWIDLKSKFFKLWAEIGFSRLVAWAEWRLVVRESLAETWEALRHQCVIEKGPEIQSLSYQVEQILGVGFDGSNMTRETCGLAVVDDQLSLVTDAILDKGSYTAKGEVC